MEHYAGIDVSLERSSVCVVDATGRIVRETKVASEPEALVAFFGRLGVPVARIGLEAGPLSQWLHAGLTGAGLEAVLLETRQVKAALSAMVVKTDGVDGPRRHHRARRRLSCMPQGGHPNADQHDRHRPRQASLPDPRRGPGRQRRPAQAAAPGPGPRFLRQATPVSRRHGGLWDIAPLGARDRNPRP
jgi:transposase